MSLEAIILAAGQGTRMKSVWPKVLHHIAGRPMLSYIIDCVRQLDVDHIHVVVGHGAEQVKSEFSSSDVNWVVQQKCLGTGNAVMQVLPSLKPESKVLILNGDVPLIQAQSLQPLLQSDAPALLTAVVKDPTGLGRIIRNSGGEVQAIVEERDASDEQRQIREINTNFISVQVKLLTLWINQLNNDNAQDEYYLTDIISLAANDNIAVADFKVQDPAEALGINNRVELAQVERVVQHRLADALMRSGTTLADPARLNIRGYCHFGQDCTIDVNVILEGNVEVGNHVTLGANSIIRNSLIGDHVTIEPNCIIDQATIASYCTVGPYARLRPQTVLEEKTQIGNFVEIKKSRIGCGSKVNHLSYIGDSDVGMDVNIGAGVITCNYDGANKHNTIIGDRVFVGSNCQLVAPIKIGDDVTIGAGSTITADVTNDELAISRARQRNITGWNRPKKGT